MARTTVTGRPDAEREEQAGGGQAGGLVAEIAFVEVERRLRIELEQDVALGAGGQPLWPERVPADERRVPRPERLAVKQTATRCSSKAPSPRTTVCSKLAPSAARPPR
jgi:hypothetical protein